MLAITISIFLGVTAILVAWVLGQSASQAIHGYGSICRELEEIDRRARAALADRELRPDMKPAPDPALRPVRGYRPLAARPQPLGAAA